MGDNENMTTRMGEVSGAAFGFIHISPHTFLSLSLFTRSLVRSFCPCTSFRPSPAPLLPPENRRSHFRAGEANEGEGDGAEHGQVCEHGFRDVGEDIESNVGEGVDMHAIQRGHVVPVGE